MRNVAVVLAGGSGMRVGGDTPKQFLPLAGRAVIEYSIDLFNAHPAIDGVGVVVHPQWRGHMESIVARNRWPKLLGIVDGGAERSLSSVAAIEAFGAGEDCNLLLHDAARPLIDADTVSRVVEALLTHEAVTVAIPATDTVYAVADGCVQSIPQRSTLWQAQTPQAFRAPLLRDAYRRALADPAFCATDDCGVLRRYRPEVPIHIVRGSVGNFKITFPEDLRRAEAVLAH